MDFITTAVLGQVFPGVGPVVALIHQNRSTILSTVSIQLKIQIGRTLTQSILVIVPNLGSGNACKIRGISIDYSYFIGTAGNRDLAVCNTICSIQNIVFNGCGRCNFFNSIGLTNRQARYFRGRSGCCQDHCLNNTAIAVLYGNGDSGLRAFRQACINLVNGQIRSCRNKLGVISGVDPTTLRFGRNKVLTVANLLGTCFVSIPAVKVPICSGYCGRTHCHAGNRVQCFIPQRNSALSAGNFVLQQNIIHGNNFDVYHRVLGDALANTLFTFFCTIPYVRHGWVGEETDKTPASGNINGSFAVLDYRLGNVDTAVYNCAVFRITFCDAIVAGDKRNLLGIEEKVQMISYTLIRKAIRRAIVPSCQCGSLRTEALIQIS